MKRTRISLGAAIMALVLAASAAGFVAGHVFTVKKGDRADFNTKPVWSCFNTGPLVRCQSGDALPFTELLVTRAGGVTVKVHTLRDPQGGHLTRTYDRQGQPIYVFSAL